MYDEKKKQSSEFEKQPPFGDRKKQYTASNEGGGLQNQLEHHVIFTEQCALHRK